MEEVGTKEQIWGALIEPPDMLPNPAYGDVITIADFLEAVKLGGFIDYDGNGSWSNGTKYWDGEVVKPSSVRNGRIKAPRWATHVLWYNR